MLCMNTGKQVISIKFTTYRFFSFIRTIICENIGGRGGQGQLLKKKSSHSQVLHEFPRDSVFEPISIVLPPENFMIPKKEANIKGATFVG